jgi:hypothetical protein
MLELYWTGVQLELANMILTMHAWSEGSLAAVAEAGETDCSVEGYQTFLDQICEGSRILAYAHCM